MIGESPFMRGHVETESDDPDITVTRRMRHAPSWQETIRRQIILKAEGRWTRNMSRQQLRRDMELCMSQNIPFKTKTFEYKPSDQWLYVHGRRVLKFDLMTGYISHFTYSGVYNKVTSLLLRLFDIKVKLKGRKLTWFADRVRPGARPSPVVPFAEEVDIDLNRVYTFGDFFMNVPPWRGFHKVSATLFNEFYRVEQENGNEQP
jgi:hypothetical protein